MGLFMKLLVVLLLASGIAYYLVPLLMSGTSTVLQPVVIEAGTSGGPNAVAGSGIRNQAKITAVATVESTSRTPIALRSGGLVTAVNVREGDVITAGQVLVQLDASDLEFPSRSANMAVEDAEARVRRTDFELSVAGERLRSARDSAKDAVTEASERLRQAEQDMRHGQDKAETAVRDALSAIAIAESKFQRALHGFNRSRSLAKLPLVEASGEVRVPARPAAEGFDDSLIKYNDYVESELSLTEALLALAAARQATGKAELAKTQHKEAAELAVGIAQARVTRAQRDAATAEAALDAHTKTSEFQKAQAASALKSAQLELERFNSMAARMVIKASAEDVGATVAEVLVRAGDTVTTGTRAVVLHRPESLRARCYLPVDRLPLFQSTVAGGNAEIVATTIAFDGKVPVAGAASGPKWEGKLTRFSSAINPSSMAFLVEVELSRLPKGLEGDSAAAFALQPGMVVTLEFGAAEAK